jgi:hypothetical protein
MKSSEAIPRKTLVRLGSVTGLERAIDLSNRSAITPADYFVFHAGRHELASSLERAPRTDDVAREAVAQEAELSNLRPANKGMIVSQEK